MNGQLFGAGGGRKGRLAAAIRAAEPVTAMVASSVSPPCFTIAFHPAWSAAANRTIAKVERSIRAL
jgi:hypothetical protein